MSCYVMPLNIKGYNLTCNFYMVFSKRMQYEPSTPSVTWCVPCSSLGIRDTTTNESVEILTITSKLKKL